MIAPYQQQKRDGRCNSGGRPGENNNSGHWRRRRSFQRPEYARHQTRLPLVETSTNNAHQTARLYTTKIHKARSAEQVQAVFSEMWWKSIPADVFHYNAAIGVCARRNNCQMAQYFFDFMERNCIQPNLRSFNGMIHAYGKSKMLTRAIEFFDEMKKRRILPNEFTYNVLINAHTNAYEWERALGLLNEMKSQGVQPNVVTYSTLMDVCAKGGQPSKAMELFEQMKEEGLQPNVVVYSTLITGFFEIGDYANARAFTDSLHGRPISVFENGYLKCDLHGMTLPEACMYLSSILLDDELDSWLGVVVVTGKGLRSDPTKGPVLKTSVANFIVKNSGLEPNWEAENDGHFYLAKECLEIWRNSERYQCFKEKMGL